MQIYLNMKLTNKSKAPRKPKRIFLVEPFSIVRLAIAEWLTRTPDLAVCGEADNAASALKSINRLRPDIVLTEILGPQDLKFIQTLHQAHPRLPILVFSFRDETWYAPRALEAGADGYLQKGASVDGLADGIRRALEGRIVLSPNMRYRLLAKCWGRRQEPAPSRKTNRLRHAQRLSRQMAHEA
jgi:DNA-binding NarL/FixJ family response regulator